MCVYVHQHTPAQRAAKREQQYELVVMETQNQEEIKRKQQKHKYEHKIRQFQAQLSQLLQALEVLRGR